MESLLWLVIALLDVLFFFLIASIVLSWLLAFNIINPHQPFVRMVVNAVFRVTEPFLQPIRRLLPDLGGLDLSPIFLAILIVFTQRLITELFQNFAL